MPRPARGPDRPSRPRRSRLPLRWATKRRLAGAAALCAGLAVPAAVCGQAATSYYGLGAYTTYTDPYTGASTQTVRPFWDILGVFQRPVVSAGYVAPDVYGASYAPAVTTASYGGTTLGTSYYGGTSYVPVTSYYGGETVVDGGIYDGGTTTLYGGTTFDASCDGLTYGSTASYGAYGASRGRSTIDDGCRVVPACSPCPDPCARRDCPGGNCTSYSAPDERLFESDPVYADPKKMDPVPRNGRGGRGRTEPRDLDDSRSFDDADPADRRFLPDREREPEDSVRDAPLPGGFGPDERPTGSAYENPLDDPLDDNEFGGAGDPLTGAGPDFDDDSDVQPAGGVERYRRPSRIGEPPAERIRPLPPPGADETPFPPLGDAARGNFSDSAPDGRATPGNYGTYPEDDRPPESLEGTFDSDPNEPLEFDGDPFLQGDSSFDASPPTRRESLRLTPNDVDLTGPPADEEVPDLDLPIPADLSPVDPEENAAEPAGEAPAAGGESGGDSAAAPPRLITADLLRDGLRRTPLRSRPGRTRIARFRHRPVGPSAPTTAPDVQIANK